MLDEKYKKKLIEIIEKYISDSKIYLFGSRAKGRHRETSDVDISIDAGKELSSNLLYKIKDEIEESNIPYFVDVVDFNYVSDEMKNQILKNGILWKS